MKSCGTLVVNDAVQPEKPFGSGNELEHPDPAGHLEMGVNTFTDGKVVGRLRPHQFPAPNPCTFRTRLDGDGILMIDGIVRGDVFSIYPGRSLKDIGDAVLCLQVLSGFCLWRKAVMI
jgi:hypothetical protein